MWNHDRWINTPDTKRNASGNCLVRYIFYYSPTCHIVNSVVSIVCHLKSIRGKGHETNAILITRTIFAYAFIILSSLHVYHIDVSHHMLFHFIYFNLTVLLELQCSVYFPKALFIRLSNRKSWQIHAVHTVFIWTLHLQSDMELSPTEPNQGFHIVIIMQVLLASLNKVCGAIRSSPDWGANRHTVCWFKTTAGQL